MEWVVEVSGGDGVGAKYTLDSRGWRSGVRDWLNYYWELISNIVWCTVLIIAKRTDSFI